MVLQMSITHEHGLSETSDNSQSNMLNLVVHTRKSWSMIHHHVIS